MAPQTTKQPAGLAPKGPPADPAKKGIKNPFIYWGTVALLVIVVIAFVFVPAGSGLFGSAQGNLEFGKYANKSVAYTQDSYFAEQVKSLNDNLRQSGLSADSYQFYAYQVWRGAFERSVVRIAILDAMEKAGAFVTEARIDEKITEMPTYQENGKFSLQKYRSAPLGTKLSLRRNIRDDLLTQAYFEDAVQGQAPSAKEIAFIKEIAKDTRTIEYVAFPISSLPDSEVAAWAQANAASFKRLNLSRITLGESEPEALKVRKSVEDKKIAFEDAAKASSKDSFAEKGGAQGALYYFELESDLAKKEDAEKLLSLKPGELSPVLKTVSGSYLFFRAEAAPADPDFALPATLKDARERMVAVDRGKVEDFVAAKAKGFAVAAAADFAKASKAAGLVPKTAGPFPLNYGDLALYIAEYRQSIPLLKSVSSEATPELGSASTSEKFLTAAFSVAPGSVSEPIVLGENVIVLKVKAESDSRQAFLESPLLKDNFSAVYLKNFMPKEK
jgi:peptidyl-prolyl cis-trans isomerase D